MTKFHGMERSSDQKYERGKKHGIGQPFADRIFSTCNDTHMKTTTINLPAAVTRYFEAANRFDVARAAECFAADATVHDENHEYAGRDAIRAWIAETSRKYQPTFTLMQSSVQDNHVSLSVAVSGQFPGSPVTLDYEMELRDEKIAALTIE